MSRGLSLPARGSPRDLVLRELLTREHAARAAEVSLFARLIGVTANVSADKIARALDTYFDEITHARYARKPPAKVGEQDDHEAALLAKVQALSSGDS